MEAWQSHLKRVVENLGQIHIHLGALRSKHGDASPPPLADGIEHAEVALFSAVAEIEGIIEGKVSRFVRQQSAQAIMDMQLNVKAAADAVKATRELQEKIVITAAQRSLQPMEAPGAAKPNGWRVVKDLITGQFRTECTHQSCTRCKGPCQWTGYTLPEGSMCGKCPHGCPAA